MKKTPAMQALDYDGLGFRVRLTDVPMLKIAGESVPDVDYNRLEGVMAICVPLKPAPLTGHEIRFLRRHLALSQQGFAENLGVTRQAVIKWEKTGDSRTGMESPTEKALRLFVLHKKNLSASLVHQALSLIFSARHATPKRYAYTLPAGRLSEQKIIAAMLSAA
jgi:DNA-binding transcriptional regulator YiaG